MNDIFSDMVTTTGAANVLGITSRRVLDLIYEDCPFCDGDGCSRCKDTGRRLPAIKDGGTWLIPRSALSLPDIVERPSGRPPEYKLSNKLHVTSVGIRLKSITDEEPPDSQEVIAARRWIQSFCNRRTTPNKSYSSYSLKDAVRRWSGKYVSNGAFIEAALLEGYRATQISQSPHTAWFNMTLPRRKINQNYQESGMPDYG